MSFTIVNRLGWNARPPRAIATTTWAHRTEFIVHHTETATTESVREIQDFHMDRRGWRDIGYNWLVRDDATIYEGRGWLAVGAQAKNHNTSGIGVAYIGMNNPTDLAKRAIRWLYDEACEKAGRVPYRLATARSTPLTARARTCWRGWMWACLLPRRQRPPFGQAACCGTRR